MSVNVSGFATHMLLEAASDSLEFTYSRERQRLWNIYGAVEHQEVLAGTIEITLAEDTANVLMVLWDKIILNRVSEAVLDAVDHNWRNTDPSLPKNYIYRGEEDRQRLRLHPSPSANGRLQVIKQIQPAEGVAHWLNALLALMIASQLSLSDTQRQRPELLKVYQPILEYMLNGTKSRQLRRR